MALRGVICLLVLSLNGSVMTCMAQPPQASAGDMFWEVRQRQQAGAASQLVLARDPLAVAMLRAGGLRWKVWSEPEYIADSVPELNARLVGPRPRRHAHARL